MTLKETTNFYGKKVVWHFTDRSNLASIMKYGLYSLEMLQKHNINVACYGADALSHNLDRHYGLDKYVHLSFIKEHPMCYRKHQSGDIPNPIWLAIDISVLFKDDVLFATDVANKTGVPTYNIDQLFQQADIEVLWGRTNWSDSEIKKRRIAAKKSELLVSNIIKPQHILKVA